MRLKNGAKGCCKGCRNVSNRKLSCGDTFLNNPFSFITSPGGHNHVNMIVLIFPPPSIGPNALHPSGDRHSSGNACPRMDNRPFRSLPRRRWDWAWPATSTIHSQCKFLLFRHCACYKAPEMRLLTYKGSASLSWSVG